MPKDTHVSRLERIAVAAMQAYMQTPRPLMPGETLPACVAAYCVDVAVEMGFAIDRAYLAEDRRRDHKQVK